MKLIQKLILLLIITVTISSSCIITGKYKLWYDGAYICEKESYGVWFRFYRDDYVIMSFVESEANSDNVAEWFNKCNEAVSYGNYDKKKDLIEFRLNIPGDTPIKEIQEIINFSGKIENYTLVLNYTNELKGIEEEYICKFQEIDFPLCDLE